MADFFTSVWPVFLQEVDEQLAEIELLLLQDVTDVSAIFRYFHTLKGSFTATGFKQLSHLAHVCEDVLGYCREQKLALSQASKTHLTEALFFFRQALKQIEKGEAEPNVDTNLLENLKQYSALELQAKRAHEQNYEEFAAKARMALPALVLSLKKGAQLQHLQQLLLPFQQLAKQHGFQSLESILLSIIELSQQQIPSSSQLQKAVSQCFEQIHEIAQRFVLDLSLDAGFTLAKSLLSSYWKDCFSPFNSQANIELLEHENLLGLLKQIDSFLPLLGAFNLQKNFRYLTFLLEKQSNSEIQKSISTCLWAVKDPEALLQEQTALFIEQQIQQLQAILQNQHQASSSDSELKASLIEQYALDEASLQSLSSKQWQILLNARDNAYSIFELDLDFTQQDVAEKVVYSLRQQAQIVHSITLFHQSQQNIEQTSVRFLCVSKLNPEELKQSLYEQDPEQVVLRSDLPSTKEQTIEESFDAVKELSLDTSRSLHTIKVESRSIDAMIDQIALLQVEFNRLSHFLDKNKLEQFFDFTSEISLQRAQQWQAQLQELQQKMEQTIKQAQDSSLQLRVVRLDFALRRFYSFVNSTASQLGKQARFEIIGGDTLIDKSMVDVLAEPLAHLIRNAIDHGIESIEERKKLNKPVQGLIELIAEQRSGKMIITIRDDGAGLDSQAIYQRTVELGILQADTHYSQDVILQQIFFPGFTMAKKLSQYSGRGVGMDAVKNSIVNAGGSIVVSSEKGQGVNVQLQLPLSAVIQKVLLFRINQQIYAIPELWIKQVVPYIACEQQYIEFENTLLPIYFFADLFAIEQEKLNTELLVLQHEDYQIAIAVEEVLGQSDMLLKNKQDYLQHITGIAAASVLGDGAIALLVDGLGLFQLALGEQIQGLVAL